MPEQAPFPFDGKPQEPRDESASHPVMNVFVRRANIEDAPGIVAIWRAIAAERIFSAVDRAFSIGQERAYIQGLTKREAIFVAESRGLERQIIGFQTLDRWATYTSSMDHVGQIGTFVLPEWRGRGLGHQLAEETLSFARSKGYEKLIILVRASNERGQKFYTSLGFKPCGRLTRQTRIDGRYEDEILMELFL
ncbi:MAG: GNAT family N-acetyltransferase [Chloroflexi bacterium]|nr:GNAT family N-acetyltransferase [Chloroflexota bacterium]